MGIKKFPRKKPQAAAIRQILRQCSSIGRKTHHYSYLDDDDDDYEDDILSAPPVDVPKGHFAVYVGEKRSRFVIPITMLRQPAFQQLLQRAEEEFGFDHNMGGLTLPCEEVAFRALTSRFN